MMKKPLFIAIVLILFLTSTAVFLYFKFVNGIYDFDTCEKAGYRVELQNCSGCPKTCKTPWATSYSKEQPPEITLKDYSDTTLGFSFSYPSNWEIYTVKGGLSKVVLNFVNASESEPSKVTFQGTTFLYQTSEDLLSWFNKNEEFTDVKKAAFEDMVNAEYGSGFLRNEDIEYSYKPVDMGNYKALVAITKVNKTDCFFLGMLQCYQEDWYVSNGKSILRFFVATEKNIGNPYILEKIVRSAKFGN